MPVKVLDYKAQDVCAIYLLIQYLIVISNLFITLNPKHSTKNSANYKDTYTDKQKNIEEKQILCKMY